MFERFLVLCGVAFVSACADSTANPSPGPGDAGHDAPATTADAGCGCASGEQCCSGVCVQTASCGVAVTSVQPYRGFQNGGDWLTIHGSGFASGMQVFVGDARAPARVADAQTATVQTPPGRVGPADVKIVVGSQQATLPKSFTYGTGALDTPWTDKPMSTVRGRAPGLAVLQDGRVLIAGGTTGDYYPTSALASAEIFDRTAETTTTLASAMSAPRWFTGAQTLLDGRVLVLGGACWQDLSGCAGDALTADVFDPVTQTFQKTKSPLNVARVFPRTTLLPDGRVLVSSSNDASLEIYDPAADGFTLVHPNAPHAQGFVVRLRDGRVLIGGGENSSAAVEIYDSEKNTFTTTASLSTGRFWPMAHTLPDGHVIVLGGSLNTPWTYQPIDSIEIFDPTTSTFTTAPYKLSSPRYGNASALVRDGTIIAIGGYTTQAAEPQSCEPTDTVDQIDPVQQTVAPFAAMPHVSADLSAITMLDGSILAVGGGGCGPLPMPNLDFLPGKPAPN